MKLAILGSAGMVGQEILAQLATGAGPVVEAVLGYDLIETPAPAGLSGVSTSIVGSMTEAAKLEQVLDARPDAIIHLASIVSGEAETDFDKGYQVNFDATYALLERIRALHKAEGYRPTFIFASSIAVFGPPFNFPVSDDYHLVPRTSYGTQKAMQELLVNDYTRRGFIDGLSIRLPTVCVRPGKANLAASSFFSNIIREPLAGKPATLPVEPTVRHWFASPPCAAGFFVHALGLDLDALGQNRALTMPGVSATVGDQIAALEQVAGKDTAALITKQIDPMIETIVMGWPPGFAAERATALGFRADDDFVDIIHKHLNR